MKKYALIINTCDKFEDCWDPFFKLFETYWPDFDGQIYLNTELKDYEYKNLNIIALKVAKDANGKRLTWSECLKNALHLIEEEYVLYMQEDYFLKAPVQNDLINRYVSLMKKNEIIDCIHLTDQAVESMEPSEFESLYDVKLNQRYRLSCQAAIWKKAVLDFYLRNHESAWEFEEFGSKRSAWENHKFYVVDPNWIKIDENEILPYVFTGIIGGKWKKEVIQLFDKFNIKIDFTKRGFHEDRVSNSLSNKIQYKLKKIPIQFRHFLESVSRKS
ncbi:MAG: hypothetical protein NWQ38_14700 [Cellulophaga sp.]|nr:hypothetical protein [Cellulophaga sp.]